MPDSSYTRTYQSKSIPAPSSGPAVPHGVCTHCGAQVDVFAWKCPRCGTELHEKSTGSIGARPEDQDDPLPLIYINSPEDLVWWVLFKNRLGPRMIAYLVMGAVVILGVYLYVLKNIPTFHHPEIFLVAYGVVSVFALWVFYPWSRS